MTRIPRYICGLGLGVGVAFGVACNNNGPQDTTSASETEGCPPGTEGCYCMDDSDCDPGLVCASHTCTPEGSVDTSGSSEASSVSTTSNPGTTSEPGTSTGPTGDSTGEAETAGTECDPAAGVVNAACEDPARPYCDPDGRCVGCVELGGCGTVSSQTPACDEASGQCVQCTLDDDGACLGTTPVCDAEAQACVACSAHEECSSGACNFETGACFAMAMYVDRAADCAAGDGSQATPFCEIQDAVAEALIGQPLVVHVAPSQGAYVKQIQVAADSTVAIVRDGNGTVNIQVPNLDAVVVNDGAEAFLYNLRITGGMINKGVLCLGARVWVDRTLIEKREGHAIDGVDCSLVLRRSKIHDNNAGGLKINGGGAVIENSYIHQNGNSFGAVAGITLSNGATLDLVYTTLADNDAMNGVGESLHCANPGTVSLRNAILFGTSDTTSVNCPTATAANSVVDAPTLMGPGVMHIDALDPAWFVSPATGNFAVKVDTPFKDVAVWEVGDPGVDYDGDPRVTDDGAMDYTGADRPI